MKYLLELRSYYYQTKKNSKTYSLYSFHAKLVSLGVPYNNNGQYLYRNVQFSKASLNGVLFFYESIF